MSQENYSSDGCQGVDAIKCSLAAIGDKWSGLIVRELAQSPRRFSELERELDGISPRTLSKRLADMDEAGIVAKHLDEHESCTQYSLTAKGTDLLPILDSMAAWGEKYAQTA